MATKADFVSEIGAATVLGNTPTITFTNATDDVNLTAHGLATGDGPIHLATAGTLPAELTAATDYWVIVVDANTFRLATSRANALLGMVLAFTDDGTGAHTCSFTGQSLADRLEDSINDLLTAPGNRSNDPEVNESKAWDAVVQAVQLP